MTEIILGRIPPSPEVAPEEKLFEHIGNYNLSFGNLTVTRLYHFPDRSGKKRKATRRRATWSSMALSTMAAVIGTKVLGRPQKFSGKDKDGGDFLFNFTNYVGALNPVVVEAMEVARTLRLPIDINVFTADQKAMTQEVFYTLGLLMRCSAIRLIKQVKHKNGVEAWRKLYARYGAEGSGRYTNTFQMILQYDLGTTLGGLEDAILISEEDVEEYEDQADAVVQDDLMRGVLMKGLPEKLKENAQLQSSLLDTYEKLRKYAPDYVYARKDWSQKHKKTEEKDVSMDVDGVFWIEDDKGEGKGKGKGKGNDWNWSSWDSQGKRGYGSKGKDKGKGKSKGKGKGKA